MTRQRFGDRFHRFWHRVTEGMQISQLWNQFRADARSSYRLYAKEVDYDRATNESKGRRFLRIAGQFFWAVLEKLTPARRILLLIALGLIVLPIGDWIWSNGGEQVQGSLDFHAVGGLLMFVLLIMEVGDRVVMKRDLQIAKEIQTWLLPAEPPVVPGLTIAFATRPANTVAGDFYDIFQRPDAGEHSGAFLLAVADVAGKSVPAAMLMATFQASLKTLSASPCSLTELTSRLNRYACTNSQSGRRFTTAFLGEYEPESRTLEYVNAGHNNPILLRPSGQVERLGTGGMPLGILGDAGFTSARVTLNPGDWLVAFTDGVIEAENPHQHEYGEDRLLTVLRWGSAMPPATLLQSLLADIDRFVENAPQHDDITCVLIRAV